MAEDLLVQLALVAVLGIGAQWLAWRLGVPAILLLLGFGLVAGPGMEAMGRGRLVDPDALFGELLQPAASLAVAVILFEGGLSLRLAELTELGRVIRNLVTVGALVGWLVGTAAARLTLGLSWPLATLLGAILVVTGPTVIGPLLRHVRPSGRVGTILLWEGIVIDPIGAAFAVLIFEAIPSARDPGSGLALILRGGVQTVVAGGLIGLAGAAAMLLVFRRFWVPDHLQNAVTFLFIVAAFTASDLLRTDSGLLAVTVMGLILANQRTVAVRHIAEFKENLTVLLVSALFIVLASRLTVGQVRDAGLGSLGFTAALILIGRPATVLAATFGSGLDWRERAFLMCVAPRGIVAAAVASVFALRLAETDLEGAERLAPAAFAAIIGTVTVYGLIAGPAARRLGLTGARTGFLIAGANPVARMAGRALRREGIPLLLVDTRAGKVESLAEERLPVLQASVLSPFLRERIDPGLIGGLLALTPSEEVNSLASIHFAGLFGREHVYQLTPEPEPEGEATAASDPGATAEDRGSLAARIVAARTPEPGRAVARELHGRILFGAGATYRHLMALLGEGAEVERIAVDGAVDAQELAGSRREGAVPLFWLGAAGEVVPVTVEAAAAPRGAEALLALVPPERGEDPV
jgi:NhaP-type Na+/H+ or K+/H+ antiporter/Trk K+ transport system NAD-binding subunit